MLKVGENIKINRSILITLLLVFLSGRFTITSLIEGVTLKVRWLLYIIFLIFIFVNNFYRTNKETIKININLLLFLILCYIYFIYTLISAFYTNDPKMGLEKIESLFFLGLLILGLLITLTYTNHISFFKQVAIFFTIVGFVYAIPVLYSVFLGASRGDIHLSGPNVVTRILFFASCSSFYLFKATNQLKYIMLITLFLASIVMVGSRGGLISAISVIIFVFFIKTFSKRRKIKWNFRMKLRTLFLLPLFSGVILLLYKPMKKVFMDRFIGVTFGGNEVYTSGRDIIYKDAIELIKEEPLIGYGLDAFTALTGHVYPHNLLLEMTFEIGITGAIIFMYFLSMSLWIVFKMKESSIYMFSILPLYMIMVQMFSGEFYDFRYYFFWIIPLFYYGTEKVMELKTNNITVNKEEVSN